MSIEEKDIEEVAFIVYDAIFQNKETVEIRDSSYILTKTSRSKVKYVNFEGYTFIISGVFIITLIIWMSREGPKMREKLENKLEQSIKKDKLFSRIRSFSFLLSWIISSPISSAMSAANGGY